MAKPPRHIPRDSSRRRMSVYIAVAAFIAVDILLIAIALGSARITDAAEASRPIPTFSAAGAVDPASTATPQPTVTSAATPTAITVLPLPPTRLLSAVDGQTAWRAQTGPCPATSASPELTIDGGATWKTTDATGPAKVTALQSLSVTSEKVVEMVGLAKSGCVPQFVKTFVSGDNYASYPDSLAGAWFVDPADRATIHSPAGSIKEPCADIVTLAVRDDKSAAALCADGEIFSTRDAGATWSEPASPSGVVNLAATDNGYLAAAVGTAECTGVQLLSVTATLATSPVGCYPSTALPSTLTGNVAVSGAAGTFWLWAGDSLARSSDGGASWK